MQNSVTSLTIASDLIKLCLEDQNNGLQQVLTNLKERKNNNYQKLTQYIFQQLESSSQIDHTISLQILSKINRISLQTKNHQAQMKCIGNAFHKYWIKYLALKQSKEIKQFMNEMLKKYYFQLRDCLSEALANTIHCLLKGKDFQQYLREKQYFKQYIQNVLNSEKILSEEKSRKICTLIHFVDLYDQFEIKDLANIAAHGNIHHILFFFKNKLNIIQKQLCEFYIWCKLPKQQKDIKKLISHYNLNSYDYPAYVKMLNKKCIRHYFSTQPIFVTELKVTGRNDIIECLIEELIDSNRFKQALHFINKYKMEKFYHLRGQNKTYNPNYLIHKDQFKPTQEILAQVYKKYEMDYLKLSDFGCLEKNVKIINDKNWEMYKQRVNDVKNSCRIGIDSENKPSFNSIQKKQLSILQIAVEKENSKCRIGEVYIFDLESLRENKEFVEWFSFLVKGYKGEIVGHTVKEDVKQILKLVGVQTDIKTTLVDIGSIFKANNPEDPKSSLQHICAKILKKKLSKYEQCSGWQNRPLRKAQLHYAALDAVLPIIIVNQMK